MPDSVERQRFEFDEDKHPRGPDGKWEHAGGDLFDALAKDHAAAVEDGIHDSVRLTKNTVLYHATPRPDVVARRGLTPHDPPELNDPDITKAERDATRGTYLSTKEGAQAYLDGRLSGRGGLVKVWLPEGMRVYRDPLDPHGVFVRDTIPKHGVEKFGAWSEVIQTFEARRKHGPVTIRASKELETDLASIFRDAYRDAAATAADLRGTQAVLDDAETQASDYARERSGTLITDIDETSRERTRNAIADSLDDEIDDDELHDRLSTIYGDDRADLIARTETQMANNLGTVGALKDAGEEYVYVTDPCECGEPICDVDGEIWTLEEAEAEPIGHPRCGRDFRPLTGDELSDVRAEEADDEKEQMSVEGLRARVIALERQAFDFEEAKHPRAPDGRWTDDDGNGDRAAMQSHLVDSKGGEGRPLTGPASKPITAIVPGSERVNYVDVPGLAEMHDRMGIDPSMHTNPEKYGLARARAFKDELAVKIRISDLTFTQPRVNMDKVNEIRGKDKAHRNKELNVLQSGGKLYLMDGHHHVAAAMLDGKTKVHARVMTVGSTKRWKFSAEEWSEDMAFLFAFDADNERFYSEQQERDDRGRWTAEGAVDAAIAKVEAAPGITMMSKPSGNGRFMVPPITPASESEGDAYIEATMDYEMPRLDDPIVKQEMVPIASLRTPQDVVEKTKVIALLKQGNVGHHDITVLRSGGVNYLHDGNHRASALHLLGVTHVNAKVIDIDRIAGTLRGPHTDRFAYDEDLHPRGAGGKWVEKGGGEGKKDTGTALVEKHELDYRQASVNPDERAMWVDRFGRSHVKDGTWNEVRFTPDELKTMKDATFSHNHPSGGSFSPQDLSTASIMGMREVRAFDARPTNYGGTSFVYSMKPGEGGWPKGDRVQKMMERAEEVSRERFAEFNSKVNLGVLSINEASLHHWHGVWTKVAPEFGMKYSRTKSGFRAP